MVKFCFMMARVTEGHIAAKYFEEGHSFTATTAAQRT